MSIRLWRDERGSFTLEASMVFPVILITTITILLFSLFHFKQASLQQTAETAAERTAYVWDNSRKEWSTGKVGLGQYDSLYWRLTQDNVSNLFAFLLPTGPVRLALPSAASEATVSSEPASKLGRTAGFLSNVVNGELLYSNQGMLRSVKAELETSYQASLLGGARTARASSKSFVIDPVETIRLVDVTRTFISEVQSRIRPKQALQAMAEPKPVPEEPLRITSHAQAAAYVRTLVGGQAASLQVNAQTKREVDALDAAKVAHQAFYSFNESQLRQVQMPKDVELLRSGVQLQGVVWHFFKLSKQDKVKLSQGLKQELERNGIVVIIHE